MVLLGCVDQRFKRFRLIGGHVGQDFAIKVDLSFDETFHETAIRQAMFASGGVDPLDPQRAELTLFQLPADIGVLTGFFDSLIGHTKCVFTTTAIAFGLVDNFFVAGVLGYAAFNS
jgi:hypothetical protein